MTNQELADANGRIEALLQELASHGDAEVPPRVHELVRLLSALYGAGLARVLTLVGAHPHGGAAVVARLGDDPLVGALLALHDLHPLDLPGRVARAVDQIRPHAALRGVSITLLDASTEAVTLRLQPASPTGRAAADEIAHALSEAIGALAPEVAHVAFERADEPIASPLIQIRRGRPATTSAPGS